MAQEAARQLDAHRFKRFLESLKPDFSKPGSLVRLAVLGSTAAALASGAVVGINHLFETIDWNQAADNRDARSNMFFQVDPATLVALEISKTPTPTLTRTPTDTDLPPTPTPTPSLTETTTSTPTDTETSTPTPTRTSRPTLLPTRPTATSTVTSTKEAPPVENGTGVIYVNGQPCRIIGRGEGMTVNPVAGFGVPLDILDWLGLSQSVAGKSEGPQGELNVEVSGNIVDLKKVPFLEVKDIDILRAVNMQTNSRTTLHIDPGSIFSGLRIGDAVYSGNPGQGESFYVGVDCP